VTTHTRLAAFFLLIAAPVSASSPLAAHFHPSEEQHVVGGPVFVVFNLVNHGAQPLRIQIANALSPCAGYLFQIDGEKRADGRCDGLPGYSCGSGTLQLAPGAKTTQRVLLNYYYEFPRAGPYHIHAKRTVTWWPAAHDFFGEHREQDVFDEDVELDLKPANAVELRAVFSPYLGALASEDSQTREEAMQAILFLAPPFGGDTLLKMLDSEDWGSALEGLRHLITSRAREALARIIQLGVLIAPDADDLEKAERTSEPSAALKYLGEMGDRTYIPLLRKATQQAPLNTQARIYGTWAVGKLGDQDAIPFLVSEINASTKAQRGQGAVAISLTASRDAVPILLDLLQSPDEDDRQVAEVSLETLTHRTATSENVSIGVRL
jgi:HEAT repeat protein